MDKRHQETFHQTVYRDGKYAHEKVSQQKMHTKTTTMYPQKQKTVTSPNAKKQCKMGQPLGKTI